MAWNKGLTKKTDERIAKYALNVSKSIKQRYIDDEKYRFRATSKMHTKEAIQKMRKTKTGSKLTLKHKLAIKKAMHRSEVNKKLSVWSKSKLPPNLKLAQSKSPVAQKGCNNIRWNPNYQDKYGYEFVKELKNRILNRDKHECIKCKTKNNLIVHHIDENKYNNEDINLITLCRSCHMKVHHKTLKLHSGCH